MAPGTECRVTEKVNKLVLALPGVKQTGIYCRKSAPSIINDILKFYQKLIIQVLAFIEVFPLVMCTYFKVGLL